VRVAAALLVVEHADDVYATTLSRTGTIGSAAP
jgi:hypothetical protein